MKARKQFISLLMAVAMIFTCLPFMAVAEVTSIDLSKTVTTILAPNATQQLVVNGDNTPEGFQYHSSNTKVVEVNKQTGLVTAKAAGIAIVTVYKKSDTTVKKSLLFTVTDTTPTKMTGKAGNATVDNTLGRTDSSSVKYPDGAGQSANNIGGPGGYGGVLANNSSGVIEFWYYDNGETATRNNTIQLWGSSMPAPGIFINSNYTGSKGNAPASKGWHQIILARANNMVQSYIDGVLLDEKTAKNGDNTWSTVNWRGNGGTAQEKLAWFDDVSYVKVTGTAATTPATPDAEPVNIYTIKAKAVPSNGSIKWNNETLTTSGIDVKTNDATKTLKLVPDANYEVETFKINGEDKKAALNNNEISLTITKDTEVEASFIRIVSPTEKVENMIDNLPAADDSLNFNYGNRAEIAAKVAEIDNFIAANQDAINNSPISSALATKLQAVKDQLDYFNNNKAAGVKWLISKLPDANSINAGNYKSIDIATVTTAYNELSEQEKGELTVDEVKKYTDVKTKIEKVGYNEEIKALFDNNSFFNNVSTINKMNLSAAEAVIAKIDALVQKGGEISGANQTKYDAVVVKINEVKSNFDRYKTLDFSNSFNATVFADTSNINALTARPDFTSPNFIGNGNLKPSRILSKVTFDAMKEQDGNIYSENSDIPFDINTDAGLVIGGAKAVGANNVTMEIPVTPGIYEELSIVIYSHYEMTTGKSVLTVNYTEGDSVTATWTAPAPNGNGDFAPREYVADTVKITSSGSNNVVVEDKDNKGTTYVAKSGTYYLPVLTMKNLQGDGSKTRIIKSITLDGWDSTAYGVLGITAKMPTHQDLGTKLEETIGSMKTDAESIAANIETIEAVNNMLTAYRSVPNADIATDKADKFEDIFVEYDTKAVEMTSKSNFTDYENIEAVFEFKNPVDTSLLANYVTVTANNVAVENATIVPLNSKSFKVVMDNDLDYSKKYVVTVKSTLPNAEKTGFTLRQNVAYTFEPVAPIELKNLGLTAKGTSTPLQAIPESGEFDVSMNLVKNTETDVPGTDMCAVSICLYDATGELVQVHMEQVDPDTGFDKKITFESPGADATIKCFVMDGFKTMNKIWKTVEIH